MAGTHTESQNREIKFRAWDIISKQWINTFKIVLSIDGDYMAISDINGEIYGAHQILLLQYTGLKDNFGKEIYEGDIVEIQLLKCKPQIIKVAWVDNLYDDNGAFYSGWNIPTSYEGGALYTRIVIDNRFDNPEMWEATE